MVSSSGVGSLNGVTWLPANSKQVNTYISQKPSATDRRLTGKPPLLGFVYVVPEQGICLVEIEQAVQRTESATAAHPQASVHAWETGPRYSLPLEKRDRAKCEEYNVESHESRERNPYEFQREQ